MDSFKLSANAVLPIFILMLLGYLLKKLNVVDKKTFDSINKLVFRVFLPVLLFYNIYKTNIESVFNIKLICFTAIGILVVFLLGYFVALLITKDNAKRGVMLQGFFRSNFALLGLPLASYIYGEDSVGLVALMSSIVVPLFNVLAICGFERFNEGNSKTSVLQILKGIIKNPLIIGCAIGIVFLVTGVKLPSILERSVKDVSSVATPLAIIALGAEFEYSTIKESIKEVVFTVSARLVIVPMVMLLLAVLFGFSGQSLICILITFGSPVAVSSYTMAQQMGGDRHLAAHLVIISSAFCLITLFAWIFALSYLNLL